MNINGFIKRILIPVGIFLPGFSAFGQYVEYDPMKLSEESREKILLLENYLCDSVSPTHDMLSEMVDEKLSRLHFYREKAEQVTLINHPNAQIRYHFFVSYMISQRNAGSNAQLFDYLKHYMSDQTQIHFRRGCIIGEIPYGEYCYDEIYSHLAPNEQQLIQGELLKTGLPSRSLEELLTELPKDSTLYVALEKLVYEKHQVVALGPLMSYSKEKDLPALYLFLPKNREQVQNVMIFNFHPSYEDYLRQNIPGFLSNEWSDDAYWGYLQVMAKCSNERADALLHDILSSFKNDQVYRCAKHLYYFKNSIPEANHDSFALTLLPSMEFPDTVLVNHLRTNYPQQFEQKLEQRLLLVPDAYQDYRFSDSTIARFMLRNYTAQQSEHKTAVYRKLVGFSYGPVLIEAVLQLRETHREEIASILEKRHAELVKLSAIERPDMIYYPFGLSLEEDLWLESIQKAMVYLNDDALVKRVAPVIADYLGTPGAGTFDEYANILLKEANDPVLYEQMLRKIETQPYEYTYNSVVKFLLSLNNASYKQRLNQRYSELRKTTKADTLDRFESLLKSE